MRRAQVWRWQIPMDAGVVLRDRRLKTRDGLFLCLRDGEREGWGEISPLPGFSQETREEAQAELLQWAQRWQQYGETDVPVLPSVAFGTSCALAELNGDVTDLTARVHTLQSQVADLETQLAVAQQALEAQFMVEAQGGEESREGIGAFLEKRQPDFSKLRDAA